MSPTLINRRLSNCCALAALFAFQLLVARVHAGIAEVEPNNTPAAANLIGIDSNGRGSVDVARISSLSDVDYFKITTPEFTGTSPIVITMTPTSADQALDAKLSLQDVNAKTIATQDSGFDNAPETISIAVSGTTTYYIACSSADLFSLGSGDYTLSIALTIADTDDQISEATALGAIDRTRTIGPAEINVGTDVDMYAFTVVAGQRISVDIDCPNGTLAASIRLFDSGGNELAHNTGSAAPGESTAGEAYLEYFFATGGTYYVGVSGAGNALYNPLTGDGDNNGSIGPYTLTLSPGLAGTIRRGTDTTDYAVDIFRYGAIPLAIDPTARTWIAIHGWNSSRTNSNIQALAAALALARPQDQILTLDWSAAADTGIFDPFSAESSIIPVAQWAATALAQAGFRGTNLNLVGHSFGSYVSDELAKRIGGVDSLVTLDPAADVTGGFNPNDPAEINFGRDSMFSWSFHSSNFGSDKTPLTADEEFIVDTGDDIIDAHSDVVSLFAFLLTNPNNPVSQHFLLSFMLDDEFGPWIPDQFASPFSSDDPSVFGYEAYITADSSHQAPASISFVGIQTDVSSVAVPEGFTGSFGVRLTEVPATTVIVETERVSGDPDISIVKGATLVFTPANWNIYQTVTIAAAEDPDAVNGAATIQCSVGGRAIQLVTVTEIDNDPIISRPTFSATVLNNGALRALISGDLNTVYALEASTDLTNWTSFATNTITASTSAAYPFSQSTAKVFVRARVE